MATGDDGLDFMSSAELFGSVMRVIACTPNSNTNQHDYEDRVLAPCRRIRELAYSYSEHERVPEDVVQEVLASLSSVLRAKRLPSVEAEARVAEVRALLEPERGGITVRHGRTSVGY